MKKTLGLIALMFAVLLGSCSDEKKVSGEIDNLKGEWTIVTAMGKSTASGEQEPFINFTDSGTVNGNASVNHFFGDFNLDGNVLMLTNIGMTRMMGASMEVEDAVTKALSEVHTIDIKGDTATGYNKDGKSVVVLKKK